MIRKRRNNTEISFQDIMEYSPNNITVFNEILTNIKKGSNYFIPFVGAGLSKPIFPLWGEALIEIAELYFSNEENKRSVRELVEKKEYLKAAQFIKNERTEINFARDLASI